MLHLYFLIHDLEELGALDYQNDINKLEGVQVRKINMIKLLKGYEGRLNELNIYGLVK